MADGSPDEGRSGGPGEPRDGHGDPGDGPERPAGAGEPSAAGATDAPVGEPADLTSEAISEEEQEELINELERRRSLRGWSTVVVSAIAVLFSAYQMVLAAQGFELAVPIPVFGSVEIASLQLLQVNTIHVVFALVLAFLLFPPSTGGRVATRLGGVVPWVRARAGEDAAPTRAVGAVRRGARWAVLDPERERVTPVDFALIAVALLAGLYTTTEFDEIRRLRALGMRSGRPLGEVYPILELPVAAVSAVGIPLGSTSWAYVLGAAGVLLVLEATRRALGVHLMVIVASFVVYARYGFLIPLNAPYVGVLSIPRLSWPVIVQNLWYNTENGVFGIPVTVSVQFIYIFVLFGAFLEMSGAGKWFIDLAYAATGKRKGGPAKASILASGFMGTISGSSIANTVTTGAFTIPLMKRSGYRPAFAGAVEASASSGGQILPPVMGAAAFLIVEYTLTPFADVIVAAAIPAVVFFFGVWVMVHLEASRVGIGGLSEAETVGMREHLPKGWFYLVPLVLLLYYLIVERLSVARSAWFTLVAIGAIVALVAAYDRRSRIPLLGALLAVFAVEVATFATAGTSITGVLEGRGGEGLELGRAVAAAAGKLGWITLAVSVLALLVRPRGEAPLLDYDPSVDAAAEGIAEGLGRPSMADNRALGFLAFVLRSMDGGARTATTVVIAVAAAGIIPGVISVSGLGPNLTALILSVAGSSIVVLLVLTGISSIILGMGMPTTVTYIILVSMLGPAIEAFGVPILAAHLFILYFGVIADITPPVAVAAYAAAGIAQSDPFETGVQAFSLSLNKAIVPFAFVLTPGILLLRGSGDSVRVINFSDVADLGYFLPEVLLPIVGVFVGVVALGATVIGYLYAEVTRAERAAFALSALLLMAPLLLFNIVRTAVSAVVGPLAVDPITFDLLLRGIGAIGFAALAVANYRRSPTGERPTEAAETA